MLKEKRLKLKVNRLSEHATLPTRVHSDDSGLDLYASETKDLAAGETVIIPTDISIQLEPVYPEHFNSNGDYLGKVINKKYGLFIWDRSGLGSKGIHRFAGVIDSGYRGPLGVVLHNSTTETKIINKGDKIAQLVIQEVFTPEVVEVDELDSTDRGEKGFGSSDKKI